MESEIIETSEAPAAAHAFHQAVRRGPFVQVSGQGPMDPTTGRYVAPDDVRTQTERTLQNVTAILAAAGLGLADVLMLRVYLRHEEDFAAMNEAYEAFVIEHCAGTPLPSRTTVFTGLPHADMRVEIDALAVGD